MVESESLELSDIGHGLIDGHIYSSSAVIVGDNQYSTKPVSPTIQNNKKEASAAGIDFSTSNYSNLDQNSAQNNSISTEIPQLFNQHPFKMPSKSSRLDRITFGLERLPIFQLAFKWKLTDLILVGLLALFYASLYNLMPFQRQFYINDLTISHPFAEKETVNNSFLFIYATFVPLGIITFSSLLITSMKYKIQVTYISIMGLLISVLVTSLVTDIMKNWIGRLRPDFLSRCIPAANTPIDTMVFASDVCTTTDMGKLLDGFRTTPSGHSSLSFAGLGYLSLWLSGQFVTSNVKTGAWRTLFAWTPALGASIIALSRTEDYRHHFIDVILGSALGFLIAIWSYRRYFPQLSHEHSYLPLDIIEAEKHDAEGLGSIGNSTHPYERIPEDVL